jgi:hypothetical protein
VQQRTLAAAIRLALGLRSSATLTPKPDRHRRAMAVGSARAAKSAAICECCADLFSFCGMSYQQNDYGVIIDEDEK